ncbi:MAG: peptidase M14, partial [Gammaproteobacteria bacterium]|nr:peptidase M14 [Gammaproteobacteria bacterium]
MKSPAVSTPSLIVVVLIALCYGIPLSAQQEFVYWPNPDYDPSIPTIEEVLGYAPGERITWHKDAIRYFEALAAAAPDRMIITEYARSWENRELIYAVLSAAANISNLENIKAGMQSLADPESTDANAAERIIGSQPAVTWLSYGVHGNEISSTDAAML